MLPTCMGNRVLFKDQFTERGAVMEFSVRTGPQKQFGGFPVAVLFKLGPAEIQVPDRPFGRHRRVQRLKRDLHHHPPVIRLSFHQLETAGEITPLSIPGRVVGLIAGI